VKTAAPSCTTADFSLLLTVAYDGTGYSGWQYQPDSPTIQGAVEAKLERLYKQPVAAAGCSRTDAGVHALAQKVTVCPPAAPDVPAENVRRFLNNALAPEIRVRDIAPHPVGFHSRFDNIGKAYTYLLAPGGHCAPFIHRYVWETGRLDMAAMQAAAESLIGTHDFTSFSTSSTSRPDDDTIRTLHRVRVFPLGGMLAISVLGNAFLYRMVRRIAGFLVEVGRGRYSANDVARLIDARDRGAFQTAPPHGLFLHDVFFDQAELQAFDVTELPFLLK
jgi:tRNA pseudouridine38-40 synthase